MIENPGFIIEIKDQNYKKNSTNFYSCINKLPKEYGPQIIKNACDNWKWFYFLPGKEDNLLKNLIYDDGNYIVLFYGSLYDKELIKNFNILKNDLLNLLNKNPSAAILKYLNSLSGYFCGIIGDIKNDNFYAFSDNFGVAKLFYYLEDGKKVISTNLFLLKEYLGHNAGFSNFSASSIIYCGHTFSDQSIIEKVKQINPGHYVQFKINDNNLRIIDYMIYPERKELNLNESVKLVANAHAGFWYKLNDYVKNNIALLLSRGKDSRVILKYMIDNGLIPNIITYYREGNKLYPFVSFLLESNDDSLVAEKLCYDNNINCDKIKIDNIAFLENMLDILLMNHGSPGHWEIFMAAQRSSSESNYLVSGFMCDDYAGKGKHHYIFGKIKNGEEYGRFAFNRASNVNSYNIISGILKKYNLERLSPADELSNAWIEQYQNINSDDLDIIGAEGLLRTRGIGRIVPTFHQARLFAIPIYPYLDKEILNAYSSIPSKYLKGEIAHLMQVSEDNRFNNLPTTRFKISAKNERRYLKFLSVLRKLDYLKNDFRKLKKYIYSNSDIYNFSFRKTLTDMNSIPNNFINDLIPENAMRRKEYYNTIANYISYLRIKDTYFNHSFEVRSDLSIIEYNKM